MSLIGDRRGRGGGSTLLVVRLSLFPRTADSISEVREREFAINTRSAHA